MPTTIPQRAIVISLVTTGQTFAQVSELLNIPIRTLQSIYARAIERGFDPSHRPLVVHDHFVADAPRSGRPRKQEAAQQQVLSKVHLDRYSREKNMC